VTVIAAGIEGYLSALCPVAVLCCGSSSCWLASAVAIYTFDANSIDHGLARGADDGRLADEPKRHRQLLANRPLLQFTAAITLFHFANAAMLPLLGEKPSQGHRGRAVSS
jgi:hypothetical protein